MENTLVRERYNYNTEYITSIRLDVKSPSNLSSTAVFISFLEPFLLSEYLFVCYLFDETFLLGCDFPSECNEEDCVLGEDLLEVKEDCLG